MMPTFTVTELARRQGCAVAAMRRLMKEEQACGHVQIVADVVYPTELLEQRLGRALREFEPGLVRSG
jgi:hypothetical protein